MGSYTKRISYREIHNSWLHFKLPHSMLIQFFQALKLQWYGVQSDLQPGHYYSGFGSIVQVILVLYLVRKKQSETLLSYLFSQKKIPHEVSAITTMVSITSTVGKTCCNRQLGVQQQKKNQVKINENYKKQLVVRGMRMLNVTFILN